MFGSIKHLPKDVQQIAWISFGTLSVVMFAHAMLETARDALFLESIPASRLPYVYLLIAGVSFAISNTEHRIRGVARADIALRSWLIISSVITAGFWALLGALEIAGYYGIFDSLGTAGLYALYIWTGVLITLAIVQFWTMLDEFSNVSSAKRIYAFVGAGSAAGAIAGSGVAAIVSSFVDARHLLLGAAFLLALAVIGPQTLVNRNRDKITEHDSKTKLDLLETIETILERPYAFRVAALIITMTITLTVADFIFKSTAADLVDSENLGTFFGIVYLVLNILSLFVQLVVVDWAIRRLSITGALAVLPMALVIAGAGFLVTGGLIAAVGLKAVDGALKHSLNRTAVELLYVPMPSTLRPRVKAFIDVLGQRGAQAIASISILIAVAFDTPLWALGAAIVVVGGMWIALVFSLRKPYLDLFREDLARDYHRLEFGDLDVVSLEVMLKALNDPDENRVRAALDLLSEEKMVDLIPGVIVFDPRDDVVLRALEIFIRHDVDHFVPFAQVAIEQHRQSDVRASLLAAIAQVHPDRSMLERWARKDEADVAMSAKFYLVLNGWDDDGAYRVQIESVYENGDENDQRTLARAIGGSQATGFDEILIGLLERGLPEVQREAANAMRDLRTDLFLEPLLHQLGNRSIRKQVKEALVSFGDIGLEFVAVSFADTSLSPMIRWQLPIVVGAFGGREAADVLTKALEVERDGMVRHRIIKQLERLVERDTIPFDTTVLQDACLDTLVRTYELIDWRIVVQEEAKRRPDIETDIQGLLVRLLTDKESNAIDLLIRVLGLIHQEEDFDGILRGWQSGSETQKASSRELIEHTLQSPHREAVLGLISGLPSTQRLNSGATFYETKGLSYDELIHQLAGSSSRALSAIAARHITELDMLEAT